MYYLRVSKRKNKKYDAVFADGRIVSFGARKSDGTPYSQYRDRTPLKAFQIYDHNDEERRERYYKRHGYDAEYGTADWFAKKYLW